MKYRKEKSGGRMEGWTGSNEYNTKVFRLLSGGWRIQQLQTLKCVLRNTDEAVLTSEQTLRAKSHSGISGGRTPGFLFSGCA